MKKLYNRTALFHARAIVGLFALCLLALPSPALAQAIDLKLTNVTVKEAIEALNQRENYSVAIKSAGVDMQRRVSISAQNASIDEVLAQIFADQDISYTITGKSISVTKAAPKSLAADKNQLKGVVKDNLGLPVPGATIIVDGTNNGTTTMSNGDFSLENTERVVNAWIAEKGYGMGQVMNTLRLALVGAGKGPGMYDVTSFLGKEETLRRIDYLLANLKPVE